MALKALVLRKRIDEKNKALAALREKDAEFETREAEIRASVEELTEESTQEERSAVDDAVDAFDAEKKAHEEAKATLEREVGDLEGELKAEETAQEDAPNETPAEERKDEKKMETREKINVQENFVQREDVKEFLTNVRDVISEKRALTNAGLTVPTVMLGLIRENIERFSKLYDKVFVRRLSGNGRLNIMGTIPEAVWTECCANLNEMDLVFNNVEVDCNKVGAFIPVCNAILEDSDVDLANEILTAIGQAIGLALDKAILYGTGVKMPLGIVTRLAQTAEPADYPPTARTWVDLHTSNIKSIAAATTGVALFQELLVDSGAAKGKYSRGAKFWAMNETTYTKLVAESMSINASGAIVSGVNGTMPVIGGDLVVLDFIPDNIIVGGYGDLYLLGERREVSLNRSEHARFIQDQTVFKGTARYDGQPAIAEGFVAIGIGGTTPSATMSFAPDTANAGA